MVPSVNMYKQLYKSIDVTTLRYIRPTCCICRHKSTYNKSITVQPVHNKPVQHQSALSVTDIDEQKYKQYIPPRVRTVNFPAILYWTFLRCITRIHDQSMQPTFQNDYCFVSRQCYWLPEPYIQHNSIVTLYNPLSNNTSDTIWSRVVALSGDIVRIQVNTNQYIDIVIPPHHMFVLGDNTTNAVDSRMFGPVHITKYMTGRLTSVMRLRNRPEHTSYKPTYDIQHVQNTEQVKTHHKRLGHIQRVTSVDDINKLFTSLQSTTTPAINVIKIFRVPLYRSTVVLNPFRWINRTSANTTQLNNMRHKLINNIQIHNTNNNQYKTAGRILFTVFGFACSAIVYRHLTTDSEQLQHNTDLTRKTTHVSDYDPVAAQAQQQRINTAVKYVIVAAVTLQLVTKLYHSSVVYMYGRSMLPTLRDTGEYLLINRFATIRPIHSHKWRNSVVLLHNPLYSMSTKHTEPATYCKRIVAIAGDTVRLKSQNNDTIDITIPEHYMFVVGDNQTESIDSRCFGPVDMRAYVYAEAVCRLPIRTFHVRLQSKPNNVQYIHEPTHTMTTTTKHLSSIAAIEEFFADSAECYKQRYTADTVIVKQSEPSETGFLVSASANTNATQFASTDTTAQQQQQQQSSHPHTKHHNNNSEPVFSLRFVLRVIRYVLYLYIFKSVAFDVMPCIGQSMEPTIHESGDYLLVSKLLLLDKYLNKSIDVKHNDVVIVHSPLQPDRHMCKRVIALPGNIVRLGLPDSDIAIDLVIPAHYMFVLGDNQAHSIDSRMFGPIHINKSIYGRVLCAVNKFGIHGIHKQIGDDINSIETVYVDSVDEIDSSAVVLRADRVDQIARMFDTVNENRKTQLFVKQVYVVKQ